MKAGLGVRVRRFGVCVCHRCLLGDPGLEVGGRVLYLSLLASHCPSLFLLTQFHL